ncbi:MAG: mechanosensitive ion channel family protein [Clostridia bacterium]|nr:mechanosensitive ion channel family protein [Clostridia bacterium]
MAELWQRIVAFFLPWGEKWPEILIGCVIFLLLALLAKPLADLVGKIIRKLFARWPHVGSEIDGALRHPLRVFFIVLGVELAFLIISPETKWMTFIDKLFRMVNISLIAWVLLNYTPAATRQIIRFNEDKQGAPSEVAVRFMAVILRIVIVSLLAVILISEMGYNINGIIAGLGLSGLTLSLAAQNTASNLFSGFEIITDKPFDVGDYIRTASAEGFVEDITMRSTRVRTRDDLVVTIPNATLMKEAITNYSRTQLGKAVQFTVGLTYDTTTEQLQKVCGDIRAYLEASDEVDNSIISVTFKEFGDSCQNIDIMYFTVTTDKFENLKVREKVNYEIRRIVEDAGASFAFPTTTVHVEQ